MIIEPGIVTQHLARRPPHCRGRARHREPIRTNGSSKRKVRRTLVRTSRLRPADVAATVLTAVASDGPRLRYTVGRALLVMSLRRHLPANARVFRRVMRRVTGRPPPRKVEQTYGATARRMATTAAASVAGPDDRVGDHTARGVADLLTLVTGIASGVTVRAILFGLSCCFYVSHDSGGCRRRHYVGERLAWDALVRISVIGPTSRGPTRSTAVSCSWDRCDRRQLLHAARAATCRHGGHRDGSSSPLLFRTSSALFTFPTWTRCRAQ